MRTTDEIRAQHLSADDAYERFFDGYYNLGIPGESFERNVIVSPPKADVVKAPPVATKRTVRRSRRSTRRLAGVK